VVKQFVFFALVVWWGGPHARMVHLPADYVTITTSCLHKPPQLFPIIPGQHIFCEQPLINVLATHSSHLPIAIQITSFLMHITFSYTTTMGSTATESLDIDQDARMTLAISHLRANPDQSIRQIARTFNVLRLTLNHRFNGR